MRHCWWKRVCISTIYLSLHLVSICAHEKYFGLEQEVLTTFVLGANPTIILPGLSVHSYSDHLSSSNMKLFQIRSTAPTDTAEENKTTGENGVSTSQPPSKESSPDADKTENLKVSAETETPSVDKEETKSNSLSAETEKEDKSDSAAESTEAKVPKASYGIWSSITLRGGSKNDKEENKPEASTKNEGAVQAPSKDNVISKEDESKSSPVAKKEEEQKVSQADLSIWSGEDKDAFANKSHPGYSIESNPSTNVGGWLAHRAALQPADGVDPTCWIKEEVEESITQYDYMSMPLNRAPRILVLYGSLRPTSFSRKLAYEFARLLELLGCDVRTYNPRGLPVRDPALEKEVKVQELRALTHWSDGHVWVSPEMHGTITGTFKNQIDWIPLNTGSVRPTQGKTCLVAQANGGSQSFNAINALRLLARWMRMPCCTNQSSVPKAWQEFDDTGRMKESSYRDRVVDCAEEFAKFTAVMAPVSEELTDRFSERKEKMKEGRLLTQEEKENKKTIEQSAGG
mmetsp:Transcript_28065/g.39449  ORF Transcript_28065/g.39449 Transcript_28065/m.39449 type:complete len:515 (+) Transcript_28065:232-1776(+)